MSILIGADIVPSACNRGLFVNADVSALVGDDLVNVLGGADYRVFNLETPLTDVFSPIKKCGPALCADRLTIAGIKKLGANLLTLSNNHIMDQGENGLMSTIDVLEKNNISYLGAGKNLFESKKSFIADIKEKKVGFYACTEHEFSIAEEKVPGANPFDPLESFDDVSKLSKMCDFVIVLYHGGKEDYQYPSPMLQRVCRKFVENGANLVVCQHSHCIGCEEKFANGTIVYGQGNFLFSDCDKPIEQTSLLIKITENMSVEYIPLLKIEKGVRLACGDAAEKILTDFKKRNEQIKEDSFVVNEYKKFASTMLKKYLLTCSGYGQKKILRIMNRLTGGLLSKRILNPYNKKELLAIQNYLECEAHRELWVEGLKNV